MTWGNSSTTREKMSAICPSWLMLVALCFTVPLVCNTFACREDLELSFLAQREIPVKNKRSRFLSRMRDPNDRWEDLVAIDGPRSHVRLSMTAPLVAARRRCPTDGREKLFRPSFFGGSARRCVAIHVCNGRRSASCHCSDQAGCATPEHGHGGRHRFPPRRVPN